MINIAIDGPSGAGKSTIAKFLAKKLNIVYLDTGAMYRTVALYMLNNNIDIYNEALVISNLKDINLDIKYINDSQLIFLNGIDVSNKIREHHISKAASDVSKYQKVREFLVKMQRDIASKTDVVLDGRDITSYVLPNANYKFYLTADVHERAKRRHKELLEKGQEFKLEDIENDIINRDFNDMNREFAPLIKTEDSIFIDSTNLTIDQVCNKLLEYIKY